MRLPAWADSVLRTVAAKYAFAVRPAAAGSEKRRFPRFSNEFKADLLDTRDNTADNAIQLTDMSPCGVGIECRRDLSVGEALALRMTLGDRPLACTARVRWSRPMGPRTAYGLEIEGLDFLTRWRLAKSLAPRAFGPGFSELLTPLLQVSSTLMGLYVAADWLRSSPHAAGTLLMLSPYLLLAGIAALAAWILSY